MLMKQMTAEMYGYRGTVSALRALVEYIGIEHGVIEKVVEIPTMAWGVPGEYPYYLSNTNLDNDIVAAIMALDRCIRNEGQQQGSVYDERDMIVF